MNVKKVSFFNFEIERAYRITLITLINKGLQITEGSGKYLKLINEKSGNNKGPGVFCHYKHLNFLHYFKGTYISL